MSNSKHLPKPVLSKDFLGGILHLNDYAASLVKQLTPFTEMYESISRSLYPIVDMQTELLKSMKPLAELQMQSQVFARQYAKIAEDILKPLENYRLYFENFIRPVFAEFEKILAALPERTRKTLMILAKHGWYFDPEMPFGIPAIEEALESDNIEIANALLTEYFSERLPDIEQELKTKFPARANILESAFNAHRNKEYALSVPIFLIQADGICFDLINRQLYSKRSKVPVIAEYAKSIATDTFKSILLYPLTQPLPIAASADERTEDFDELNRHQVVHGESTNYDTELNSLKAISLLNYVAYVLSQDSTDSDYEEIEPIS